MRLKRQEWKTPDGPLEEGARVQIRNSEGDYTVLKGGKSRIGEYVYFLLSDDGYVCLQQCSAILYEPSRVYFAMLDIGAYFLDGYSYMLKTSSHGARHVVVNNEEIISIGNSITVAERVLVEPLDLIYSPVEVPF